MNKVDISVWFYGLVTAAVDKTLFEAGALPDVNNIQSLTHYCHTKMQGLTVNNSQRLDI